MENNFLQKFENMVTGDDLIFQLEYFEIENDDKVTIKYSAYIGEKWIIRDLFITNIPVTEIFSPATRSEPDFGERSLLQEKEVCEFLKAQAKQNQNILFNAINLQSCKEPVFY